MTAADDSELAVPSQRANRPSLVLGSESCNKRPSVDAREVPDVPTTSPEAALSGADALEERVAGALVSDSRAGVRDTGPSRRFPLVDVVSPPFQPREIRAAPPARMADRAVPVDFGRFLAVIHSPLDPDVTSGSTSRGWLSAPRTRLPATTDPAVTRPEDADRTPSSMHSLPRVSPRSRSPVRSGTVGQRAAFSSSTGDSPLSGKNAPAPRTTPPNHHLAHPRFQRLTACFPPP